MGAIRATAAAVLTLFTAVAAGGDCVTTARLISTRTSNPNLVSGPVAWSGSVLGVAKTQDGVDTAIWFAVYDETLEPLVSDRLVANDSRAIVALEWTGTEFGLFYRTGNQRMHLQRLSMMGEPIGAPVAVTPSRTVYSGDEIDIEWSPAIDAYVVARMITQGSFKGIWVTTLGRDGTQRTDRRLPVIPASRSNLSLSVTNTGTIGLFYVNSNAAISMARMTETGTPNANTVAPNAGEYLETAAYGNLFVLTHSVPAGAKKVIHWMVVDTSHNIVQPDALLLEGSGADAWPVALVAADDEIALAYVDAENRDQILERDYRLRRFTIDGTTITDTFFAAADLGAATRSQSEYDFVWTGSSYLQAAFRSTPDRLNSHLLRYCPLRATIETDVYSGRPGRPIVFTAIPEGGAPEYSYEWTFGDASRIYRSQSVARTYEEVGTYTAVLKVIDASGATYVTTYTINVVNPKRRSSRH